MKTTRRREVPHISILNALADPKLFGRAFEGGSWAAWQSFLAALFALPLSPTELKTYQQHTGREKPPTQPFGEAYAIVGRRGGKSRIAALLGVFLAAFRDYRDVLGPGERGVVMLIAADRTQARVVMGYIKALLDIPLLADLVVKRRRESIDLRNRISLEVHTASYRTVRGYTVVAAILDELAFWPTDDSAEPDVEILQALRPAMATVPGALLLGISSPYARKGVLWKAYREHYGTDSDVLVWQADSQSMNPLLDPKVVKQAYESDPASASAEYGAEFRTDVESYLSREAIDAVVQLDRHELPCLTGVQYFGFTDPSGGARDSYTLAIAHREGDVAVLDVVRETRPPFSPDQVTREYAELLKSYRLHTVQGDRYAGEWPREKFREHGVEYRVADKTKSDLYRAFLPSVNSGSVQLLDHKVLRAQLEGLERRTARGGKDSIDHAPNARDDVANAAAGALVGVLAKAGIDHEGAGLALKMNAEFTRDDMSVFDLDPTGWEGSRWKIS